MQERLSEIMMTGATGGIGQAVAAALAAAGHRLTVVGRDLDRLHVPGLQAITADLSQPQNLAHAVPEPGRLDALVHCAGISVGAIAPVAGTGLSAWRDTMTVNTLAAAELTRLMLPALRRSHGHVLFLNSARRTRGRARLVGVRRQQGRAAGTG